MCGDLKNPLSTQTSPVSTRLQLRLMDRRNRTMTTGRGLSPSWIKTTLLKRMTQVQCVDFECDLALSAAWRDAATECICCAIRPLNDDRWHDYFRQCWRFECWTIAGCRTGQRIADRNITLPKFRYRHQEGGISFAQSSGATRRAEVHRARSIRLRLRCRCVRVFRRLRSFRLPPPR